MKIIIEHKNKTYEFENGYHAYIFDNAIENDFDVIHGEENLLNFVYRVGECYLKDHNHTPLGHLTDFMAQNWNDIKELGRYEILDKFYEQLP